MGLAKIAGKKLAEKATKGALESVAKEAKALPRMSETLNPHVGKRLFLTQADRMAIDPDKNYLGGTGFLDLAELKPEKYNKVAWAVEKPQTATTMVRAMGKHEEEPIWTTFVGSPTQHRSNRVVFNMLMDEFEKAIAEDKLTPELKQKINAKLSSLKDTKTGKAYFPEDVDITHPDFKEQSDAFHLRSMIADILSGKDVGGQKGKIIPFEKVIHDTSDPMLENAPTFGIGNRLFRLSGNIMEGRPDLHPAFPTILEGEKLSDPFEIAPLHIGAKPWAKKYEGRPKPIGAFDLTRGYNPSFKITDEYLQDLFDAGYAKGGKASKGKRLDNTKKERGFLGEIRTPRGDFMTEMSVGEPNTDELFRPSIVPNLHPAEINYMIQTGEVPTDLYPISQRHAEKRIAEGKSPFWNEKEDAYAGGGLAKKIAKKLAQEIELPPASNSARTQIVGTMPTYEKARDILRKEGIEGKDVIDFGAGKGLGSTMMKADSFEPYPQGWYPTYTKSEDIPSDAYKGLLNLNVLNVLDPEMRAHTVKEIGRVMQPEGGTGLITTRGRDVMNTIGGKAGPEPMSVITSRDTYQKGFEPNELREYIKYILGGDFEYEPLNLGPAGVKIKKKAEGGSIDEPETLKEVPRTGKISGKIADVLKPASRFLEKYEIIPQIPLIGGTDLAELTGVKGVQTLAEDMSYGYKPIRNLERGKLQSSYFDPRLADAVDLGTTALGGVGLAKNLGKTAIREGMKQIETGTGMLGRNVINPRMNIIKDQGGMLVGGEKALDDELIAMKHNEARYPHAHQYFVPEGERDALKDPNAVALNNWVDTKVRKYLRNQAGTEADPILKTIESGVEHNFQPTMGDTKYYVANQRQKVGKPKEGIAKTALGKEFEYKIDSMFDPKSSEEVKAILNDPLPFADPNTAERFRASKLRTELDLPIQNEKDVEALRLLNEIPDKNVYTLSGTNITDRLGLNHVSDVLMEDLQTGRLRPEQLNQMSIEKAIRRTAEYDAEKAKAMTKAHATSVEGMPIPKAYDDGYKWVELKHETDPKKTAAALKSEGEMMGHCVGGYCPNVESGEIKIFSLRSPDGKSHVTIEARPQFSMTLWRNANMDAINSNPKLKEYDFNMRSLDNDDKYGRQMTEQDYVRIMTKEMKKLGVDPVEPPSYMELHQVKGKQNKRPDDKYQSYISDFIKNNPTKHEIVDVFELDNTNLMGVQNIADNGIVSKDIHDHPEVEKILKMLHPDVFRADAPNIPKSFSRSEELKYELFQETARDLARQGKNYLDKDDILNHLREKYLLPKKKSGGSINLNQEYKLENMRRRYG